MPRYQTALVRFRASGRTYPVNCPYSSLGKGDLVVVRMAGHANLQVVEIDRVTFRKAPCTGSIVCRETDLPEYRDGPAGVESAADLDRFLTFLRWRRYPVAKLQRTGLENWEDQEWSIAYEFGSTSHIYSDSPEYLLGSSAVIGVGAQATGYRELDPDRGSLRIRDGHLDWRERMFRFPGKYGNPYRAAAEWAERRMVHDLDEPDDTSIGEIRGAVSTDGGPAYLSDDVWI